MTQTNPYTDYFQCSGAGDRFQNRQDADPKGHAERPRPANKEAGS